MSEDNSSYQKVNFCIDDMGTLTCPNCDGLMKRLYWKSIVPGEEKPRMVFTEWYGCTDCGERIFDKRNMTYWEAYASV